MAARHQNDNATMLSIESLYQQSEVVRTLKVSQPDATRTAMKRRKRLRLPLITSKPLDSFLSDNGASAASDGLDGLVLSGLKYPAVEQDTTLPKSLNLGHVKSAIAQHGQQTTHQNSLQGRNTDTDPQTASDDNADPMQAIRQAVMTAAEEHSQPAAGETKRSEKSALQQDLQALIAKLVTVIEEEVEDRLIRQNVSQQPAPARQAAKRPAKTPAKSASPVAKKAKSKAKVRSSSAKTGKAPSRTVAKKDRR